MSTNQFQATGVRETLTITLPEHCFIGFRGFEGVVRVTSHGHVFQIARRGPASFVNVHKDGTLSGDLNTHVQSGLTLMSGLRLPLGGVAIPVTIDFEGTNELIDKQSFYIGRLADALGTLTASIAGKRRAIVLGRFEVTARPAITHNVNESGFSKFEATVRRIYVRADLARQPKRKPLQARIADPLCIITSLAGVDNIATAQWG